MNDTTVITISRQLGSGGSYIGQVVAKRLGYRYLDREILRLVAETLQCEEATLQERDERVTSFWRKCLDAFQVWSPDATYVPPPLYTASDAELYAQKVGIMKSVAHRESCVIIGRAAVGAFRDAPNAVHVFLHASTDFRVRRVMDVYQVATEDEAQAIVAQSDREREQFFTQMTGWRWMDATRYHLCIDTSTIPLDTVADMIIEYVNRRMDGGAETGG